MTDPATIAKGLSEAIPDELVEEVRRIILEVMNGRAMSKNAAQAAIRAVLDWQAKHG